MKRWRNRALALIAPVFVVMVIDGARLLVACADVWRLQREHPELFAGAAAAVVALVIEQIREEEA